jgi:hypothetical protein
MPLRNEAQTRRDLIDPALEKRGWARDDVRVEETARAVDIDPVTREARRRLHGRTDYVLRRALEPGTEPLPLAILEAKRESFRRSTGWRRHRITVSGICITCPSSSVPTAISLSSSRRKAARFPIRGPSRNFRRRRN